MHGARECGQGVARRRGGLGGTQNGASTEERNNQGYTPLLVSTLLMAVASRNGRHTAEHEAVLSFLVIRGGCVDATDPLSASVLHILCAFGCAAGILYLLADISDHRIFLRPRSLGEFQSILSPLHTVESKEQIGKAIARDPFLVMAVSLLRAHFVLLLNRAGPGFLTPLHYAAASGDPVTVSLLLAAGCNPDMVDARGWTPLFWAALSRSPAVVKLLNVNPLPNDFVGLLCLRQHHVPPAVSFPPGPRGQHQKALPCSAVHPLG